VTARVSTLTALLVPLLAFAQHAPPAQPFQRLDGCAYKPQRWDDGDSFHVILSDQKELIFRLYFVDTPEEERVYADRIAEQAAYFGITPDAAIQIGREAREFTKQALTKPFTIYTRWRRALGRSTIWRYYAIVVTSHGHDLNVCNPARESGGFTGYHDARRNADRASSQERGLSRLPVPFLVGSFSVEGRSMLAKLSIAFPISLSVKSRKRIRIVITTSFSMFRWRTSGACQGHRSRGSTRLSLTPGNANSTALGS
jgi:endonuclease YncB( thermonuclease family)